MTTLRERTTSALPYEVVQDLARFCQRVEPMTPVRDTHLVLIDRMQMEQPILPIVMIKQPLDHDWRQGRPVTFDSLRNWVRCGYQLRFAYACDELKLSYTVKVSRIPPKGGIMIEDIRDITVQSGVEVDWRQNFSEPFTTTIDNLTIPGQMILYLSDRAQH